MTMFTPGKVVRSRKPAVTVDNVLDPGRWLFRLTVLDDERNESRPTDLIVTVRRGRAPDPVTQPVPPIRRIPIRRPEP